MSGNTFLSLCPECCKPIQTDYLFCPYCGAKIEYAQDIKRELEANQIHSGRISLMLLPVERPLNEQETTIFSHFFSTVGTCTNNQIGAVSCHFEDHQTAWGSVDDWTGYDGDTCVAYIYKIAEMTAAAAAKQLSVSSNTGSHFSSVISLIQQSSSCFESQTHTIQETIEVPEAHRGIVSPRSLRGEKTKTHFFLIKDPLGFSGTYAISLADCYEKEWADTYSCTYN